MNKSRGHSIEILRVKQLHSENKKSLKQMFQEMKKWFANLKDKWQVIMKGVVTDVPSSFP